jgi:hypothetical protein
LLPVRRFTFKPVDVTEFEMLGNVQREMLPQLTTPNENTFEYALVHLVYPVVEQVKPILK